MNGCNKTAANLIDSKRLYKTVPNLGLLLSSLARIQGVVSSIYLLHLRNTSNISSIAAPIFNIFIF